MFRWNSVTTYSRKLVNRERQGEKYSDEAISMLKELNQLDMILYQSVQRTLRGLIEKQGEQLQRDARNIRVYDAE